GHSAVISIGYRLKGAGRTAGVEDTLAVCTNLKRPRRHPRPFAPGRPGIVDLFELCRLLRDSNRLSQPPTACQARKVRSISPPTSGIGAMPSTVRSAPLRPQ